MTIGQAEKKWLSRIVEEYKKEMIKAPAPVSSHNIKHVSRVWENAKRIGQNIRPDWDVLIGASFLHDLGRHYPEGSKIHGPLSARLARPVLIRMKFPREKIPNTLLCIRYHDEQHPSEKRKTLESKILYDSDKIDVYGPIGIYRIITFWKARKKNKRYIIDYALRALPRKYKMLHLEQSKKIAKKDYMYSMNFFRALDKKN